MYIFCVCIHGSLEVEDVFDLRVCKISFDISEVEMGCGRRGHIV